MWFHFDEPQSLTKSVRWNSLWWWRQYGTAREAIAHDFGEEQRFLFSSSSYEYENGGTSNMKEELSFGEQTAAQLIYIVVRNACYVQHSAMFSSK